MGSPPRNVQSLANRRRAQWEFAHGATVVSALPAELHLGLTNDCNFHCPYCIDHYLGNTAARTRLNGATREKMLEMLPRLTSVAFHGISEFLLDQEFFAILDRCAAAGVTLLINTNGSVCTLRHVDALADYPAGLQVNFSLDAASPETYRIMRGWDFARVLQNVATFVAVLRERRRKHGAPTHLQVSFVIARCNLHEVAEFVRLAHALHVDSAICKPLHQYGGLAWIADLPGGGTFDYRNEIPTLEPDRFNREIARARQAAAELKLPVELPAPVDAATAPGAAAS